MGILYFIVKRISSTKLDFLEALKQNWKFFLKEILR